MGRFLLQQLNLHTWVVSAMSAVGHVGKEAAVKLPPSCPQSWGSSKNLLWLITTSKEKPCWRASSDVVARLGMLAVEPTFLARVHKATW